MASPTSANASDTCRNVSAAGASRRQRCPMAQDVTRLKELLFDREARAITDLTARMDAVFERTGSQERFAASVGAQYSLGPH